jgi:hypothetical protein
MSPGKSKSTDVDGMHQNKPVKTDFPAESNNLALYNDSRLTT